MGYLQNQYGEIKMISKLFTKAELEEIERRKKGDRTNRTGIWFNRVVPKIKELLELFKQKKEFQKLITDPKKK